MTNNSVFVVYSDAKVFSRFNAFPQVLHVEYYTTKVFLINVFLWFCLQDLIYFTAF